MSEPTVTLPRSVVEKVREALIERSIDSGPFTTWCELCRAAAEMGDIQHTPDCLITLLDAALAQPGNGWRPAGDNDYDEMNMPLDVARAWIVSDDAGQRSAAASRLGNENTEDCRRVLRERLNTEKNRVVRATIEAHLPSAASDTPRSLTTAERDVLRDALLDSVAIEAAPADTRDAVVEAARVVANSGDPNGNAVDGLDYLRDVLAAHDRSAP